MADEIGQDARPHQVDVHVGAVVRSLRKSRLISQSELATRVGLTFQQIQKYETGKNRISASKLYEIAQTLDVEVEYFFAGLADRLEAEPTDPDGEISASKFFDGGEGRAFAADFMKIKHPAYRQEVLNLIKLLANSRMVD